MDVLETVDEGIWVATRPLKMPLFELGARMTVVRLGDGGLWISSPVALDEPIRRAVDGLGPVRALVGPNRFHHLFLKDWIGAYPQAEVHGASGLAEKRADLPFTHVLGDEPASTWAGTLEQHPVGGIPSVEEVVFFHPASRTLVVTDLVFNVLRASGLEKLFWKANGCYGRVAPSRFIRLLVRERHNLRLSVERILEWDFDRIVLAHGEIVRSGGRDAFRRGFAWLLD